MNLIEDPETDLLWQGLVVAHSERPYPDAEADLVRDTLKTS